MLSLENLRMTVSRSPGTRVHGGADIRIRF